MCDAILKKTLRKSLIARRNDILDKDILSKEICERLVGLEEYKNAKNILCYASFTGEVDTKELLDRILKDGKNLFLPRCDVKNHTMQAIEVNALSTLKKGAYGIAEPSGEGTAPEKLDLVIVPLVGFDRKKARLGYGGGYYDRFLPETNAVRIAIAFSNQEVSEIPIEKTDALLDIVVTEKEVIV